MKASATVNTSQHYLEYQQPTRPAHTVVDRSDQVNCGVPDSPPAAFTQFQQKILKVWKLYQFCKSCARIYLKFVHLSQCYQIRLPLVIIGDLFVSHGVIVCRPVEFGQLTHCLWNKAKQSLCVWLFLLMAVYTKPFPKVNQWLKIILPDTHKWIAWPWGGFYICECNLVSERREKVKDVILAFRYQDCKWRLTDSFSGLLSNSLEVLTRVFYIRPARLNGLVSKLTCLSARCQDYLLSESWIT